MELAIGDFAQTMFNNRADIFGFLQIEIILHGLKRQTLDTSLGVDVGGRNLAEVDRNSTELRLEGGAWRGLLVGSCGANDSQELVIGLVHAACCSIPFNERYQVCRYVK